MEQRLKVSSIIVIGLLGLLLSACVGEDQIPEEKLEPASYSYTRDDVERVVGKSYVSVFVGLEESAKAAPQACAYVGFTRHKVIEASENAADADAVLFMVPGIFEGANGFDYLARHLVYQAKVNEARNLEVWALDRRANCLEDRTGFIAGSNKNSPQAATDVMLGYYYGDSRIDGASFQGFVPSNELSYLASFGIKQTTEDIFAIMKFMMPNLEDRQSKLYLGGHSLGGIHTSAFLAWDFDGDVTTLHDAGFNNVAGAFGFDTIVSSLSDVPATLAAFLPFNLSQYGINVLNAGSEAAYTTAIDLLNRGVLPRTMSIPKLFTPEVLAIPEALGILAVMDPDAESEAIHLVPRSDALNNILKVLHFNSVSDLVGAPSILNFRYTNEALVGLFFDDDFAPIGFLGTSLGHLSGGGITQKQKVLNFIANLPILGVLIGSAYTNDEQFIAIEESENEAGQGPLYSWAAFDEVANQSDPHYTSIDGSNTYTELKDEMVDIQAFSKTLYEGETNFTEWYFPLRMVLDVALALPFGFATEVGLNVYHGENAKQVRVIEFLGSDGVIVAVVEQGLASTAGETIILEGQNHVDPMYEVANAPSRHENVVIPALIEFTR